MHLFKDLKVTLQRDLDFLGIAYPPVATTEDILLLRYTHMRKTIRPRPRRTRESTEFRAALRRCSQNEQEAMTAILAKFCRGEDVNGHLSKASTNPNVPDGLLYDWDVYHMHVSNTKATPMQTFFDRTGPVALAKVASDDAYFLDIRPHGAGNHLLWTQQDILEIINCTWPALLDNADLRHAVTTVQNPTAANLQRLRGNLRTGAGATIVPLQIGNRVIAPPGGGMATDGTSVAVMDQVDRTQYAVKAIETYLTEHGNAIKADIQAQIYVPVNQQDFRLVRELAGWIIHETASDQAVSIHPLDGLLATLPAAPTHSMDRKFVFGS